VQENHSIPVYLSPFNTKVLVISPITAGEKATKYYLRRLLPLSKIFLYLIRYGYGTLNAHILLNMKIEKKIPNKRPEQQKELVNILMGSELYLSLPLEERYLLLKFILDSYSFSASIESKKDPSRLI